MLLLPLLLFCPSLLGLMFAVQNSALYRYPIGRVSFGKFKCDPYYYLWEEKLKSSMVKDQLECSFLCIGERKCSSFNIAAFPDSEGLYLCELLANDKFRGTGNSFKNASFHHFSPWVSSPYIFGDFTRMLINIKCIIRNVFSFQSPCESAPCKNGGVCVPEYERNSYHCDCKPGFCGTHCKRGGT